MAAPEGYKTLGKIGISYKGDYNSNIAYERLDAVYHNGSTYLAIKDAPDGAPRDDKLNWIYLAKGFSGDIGYSEIAFTEAENRENINTGESVKTVFGKIKKFFADLTAPAFAQMITSKDDLLTTKATGYVPDAKAVADAVTDVTGKLESKIYSIPIKTKESKTITVELYACAMLLVAGATMYYFCNGYLIPINVSDSVTMGLSSDYRSITVSNTTEVSNYFLSIVAFSDISYTIS